MSRASSFIAIVDNDPSVLKALARLLAARSFQVRTFSSAQDFLASLPAGRPACLVVDLHMPRMTGLELLRRLALEGMRIPTIIITAHGTEMRERCKAAGAVAFLTKPLHDTSLVAAIDAARKIAA